MTSTFWQMEDDLNFWEMEDDLDFLGNERRPQFWVKLEDDLNLKVNGGQTQFESKWKTTSILK